MRILYPIEGDGGGAVSHVLSLATELTRYDIKTLILFLTSGPSVKMAKNLNLTYKVLPCRFFPDIALVWKLVKIIQYEKIDTVHTHTIRGNFYGRTAKLLSRRPTISITTVHSFLIDELGGSANLGIKQNLLHTREVCTRRFVDQFISVSRSLKYKLVGDGIPETKIKVITHGVPIPDKTSMLTDHSNIRDEYNIGKDETIVGIIGRLVSVKNHELFLVATRRVLTIMPEIKFLIVGDGPLEQHLKQLATELKISDSVIFTGWRNDIERCIKALDILVSCSATESQGLAILEAMSFCKPVIAADVNQLGETVIHGETGFLIPPNDVTALVKAILKLVQDKDRARRLGEQARSLLEKKYPLERMVRKTSNLYKTLYNDAHGFDGRYQKRSDRLERETKY